MELLEKFKNKLINGKSVIGPFMKSTDPAFIEVAGYSGFDFVILDMEHGPADFPVIQNLIRAALISNVIPIVRTSDCSEISIAKPLDLGALGVQIPQVNSAKMARECIKAAKFFPEGERGVCRFVRAAKYSSLPRDEYFKKANENLVIIQLEGKEAILDIDNILKVKGIDIIFIGPYDLSQSLGVPGQVSHPDVINAMNDIVKQAHSLGIIVGTFTDTPQMADMWKKAGVQYISYSVDVGIFHDACSQLVKDLISKSSL
jgi:4-hydroxy-2-oxoheptanedioate aldolase